MFNILKQTLGKKQPKSPLTDDEKKAMEQANYHCYWFCGDKIIHIFTQSVNNVLNTKSDGSIIDTGVLELGAPTLLMTNLNDAKLFDSTINMILKDTLIIAPTPKKRIEDLEVSSNINKE